MLATNRDSYNSLPTQHHLSSRQMASDEAAAAAAGAGSGYVVIPECEADLPCNICNSELFTFDNDILRCKACKVVVHQGKACGSAG